MSAAKVAKPMSVQIRDEDLRRRVLREKRSRRDRSLSKTLGDLVRERLAIQDTIGRGTVERFGGHLVIGRVVDTEA